MDKKTRNMLIITVAGFFIGTAEALIYYNLGESKQAGKKFSYKIPPKKELLQTATIVMITSVLTAAFTGGIEKVIEPDNQVGSFSGGYNNNRFLRENNILYQVIREGFNI